MVPLENCKKCGDLDEIIVGAGLEKLPKVQYITQSGHTGHDPRPG